MKSTQNRRWPQKCGRTKNQDSPKNEDNVEKEVIDNETSATINDLPHEQADDTLVNDDPIDLSPTENASQHLEDNNLIDTGADEDTSPTVLAYDDEVLDDNSDAAAETVAGPSNDIEPLPGDQPRKKVRLQINNRNANIQSLANYRKKIRNYNAIISKLPEKNVFSNPAPSKTSHTSSLVQFCPQTELIVFDGDSKLEDSLSVKISNDLN